MNLKSISTKIIICLILIISEKNITFSNLNESSILKNEDIKENTYIIDFLKNEDIYSKLEDLKIEYENRKKLEKKKALNSLIELLQISHKDIMKKYIKGLENKDIENYKTFNKMIESSFIIQKVMDKRAELGEIFEDKTLNLIQN